MDKIYYVSPNAKQSLRTVLLYTFDDNEAVIKMIIKDRSPTMRHVSRTDRVALDWLFNSINVDPHIQINHVDTGNQLADILTKSTFTRDEWHHLLRLLNIMSNAASSYSHVSNKIDDPFVMSKRQMQDKQQGAECDRVAAKSRPAGNLVALTSNRCCTMPSLTSFLQSPMNPIASYSIWGSLSTGRSVAMNANASNTSSSQEWHGNPDTDLGTGRLVERPKERATTRDLVPHNRAFSSHDVAKMEKGQGKRAPEAWPPRGRHIGSSRHQHGDMVNMHDHVQVGRRASR